MIPQDNQRSLIVSVFELGGRLVLLSAAVLYALGFLVENIHLARYGYFSLTLFERRYAMAGFWALCPLLLYFIIDRIVTVGTTIRGNKNLWLRRSLGAVGALATIYGVQNAVSQIVGVPVPWYLWWGFTYGAGFLYLLMARNAVARLRGLTSTTSIEATRQEAPKVASPWGLARSILAEVEWVWAPVCVSYLVLFTYNLFVRIPASWGGGGAERVQFLLTGDAAALLPSGADNSLPQMSAPVTLLATTADDYVVLLDSTRVAYIRRDLVRAVTLGGRFKPPPTIRRVPERSKTDSTSKDSTRVDTAHAKAANH